ncbi:MAG: KH domain-containing protein [Actinobacteria bacterium]|nr:KH domain-containing protein [Actinomycetota bacterium]
MKREIITEGSSVDAALEIALESLGVQQDAVQFEVVGGSDEGFAIGTAGPSKVRVWIKESFYREIEEARAAVREIVVGADGETTTPLSENGLSAEDLDKVADEAVAIIQGILSGFGIAAEIDEYEGDDGEIILDIVGDDLGILIGRHGRTLEALQVLVGAATNQKLGFRHAVVVDVEGYRNRLREKLESIARRAAEKAVKSRGTVRLRPMSSYERRIVHLVLKDDRRVVTVSEGQEPNRCVSVINK